MVDDALARLAQYRGDLFAFAENCLKVRGKGDEILPLRLNKAQRYVHKKLEEQKAAKGYVRALVLKGRQQGVSTYVAARYYHRASLNKGVNTFILAHEQSAADNLFKMVDRYQRLNPIRPHVGDDNVKALEFDLLESTYVVGTAGQKAGGRGRSVSLFHGSEVAFWPHARDHFAASVQAVPLLPNTEIILESTANGVGGEFFERWHAAGKDDNDYITIFLPWFMTDEYAREPDHGFALDPTPLENGLSESEYAEAYKLTLPQMSWRRSKIDELRSEELFRQEYPAEASEAWVAVGHEPFIPHALVLRARKREREGVGPLVFGVDPAGMGGDRFVCAARRGLQVPWIKERTKQTAQEGILWIKSLIDEHDPARVNIDAGGIGHAIVTGLKLLGSKYVEKVRAVNFGGTPQCKIARPKTPGPSNRRAEMWLRSRDWLQLEEGVQIPDIDEIQADACAPRQKPKVNGDWVLESKDEMKRRGVRSPDYWDGVALTFAQSEFLEKYSEPRKAKQFGDLDSAHGHAVLLEDTSEGGEYNWMG